MPDEKVNGKLIVTDKIGIGIEEPIAQLHIASSTSAPSQTFLESGGALLKLSVDASGAAIGTDNAFPLSIKTDDTPRISIDKIGNISLSGALSVQNTLTVSGNVGIGTTSPSYKLAIAAGDINIDDGCALRQAGRWVIGGDSNVLSIGSSDKSDGRDISFAPGFARALTIKKDTGNVGIGTTNPVSKLSIFSTQSDQSEGMIHLEVTEPFNGGHRPLTMAQRNSTNTARLDWTFEISRGGIDTPGLSIFRALRPDGTSPSFVVPLHFAWNGNIGMGTMEPLNSLHVARSAHLNAIFDRTDTQDHLTAVVGSDGSGFRFSNSNFFFIGTQPYSARNDNSAGTELLRITSAGNVGIGTTNPTTKLHVLGADPVTIENAGEADILFKDTKNGQQWQVGTNSTGWYVWDNDYRLVVKKSSGNIGIGTTNPAYKLDVVGPLRASNFNPTSDARLKTKVMQLTNVLEKLEKIRGISFEWNELYESLGRSTAHKEIGVTAQEVEAVFPELVTTWGDEGYKAVDYGRLTGVLIEAAKELKAENEALKQRIEALEKVIENK